MRLRIIPAASDPMAGDGGGGRVLDQGGGLVGGPLGLAPEVLQRARCVLSFSRMTFPHQMMRVILREQIYRGMKIMPHEPYHR